MGDNVRYSLRGCDILDNNDKVQSKQQKNNCRYLLLTIVGLLVLALFSLSLGIAISNHRDINLKLMDMTRSTNQNINSIKYDLGHSNNIIDSILLKLSDTSSSEDTKQFYLNLKKTLSSININLDTFETNNSNTSISHINSYIEHKIKQLLNGLNFSDLKDIGHPNEDIVKLALEIEHINKQLHEINDEIINIKINQDRMRIILDEIQTNQKYNNKDISNEKLSLLLYKISKIILYNHPSFSIDNLQRNETSEIINLLSSKLDEVLENSVDPSQLKKVDHALVITGTQIIYEETSSGMSCSSIMQSIFSTFGLIVCNNGPDMALSEKFNLGDCWPFESDNGNLTIELSNEILPRKVGIDHKYYSSLLYSDSMPKDFAIYGVNETAVELLGNFTYEKYKPEIQLFNIHTENKYKRYQLRILSNYGNSQYTCLYRFRIYE